MTTNRERRFLRDMLGGEDPEDLGADETARRLTDYIGASSQFEDSYPPSWLGKLDLHVHDDTFDYGDDERPSDTRPSKRKRKHVEKRAEAQAANDADGYTEDVVPEWVRLRLEHQRALAVGDQSIPF